MACSPTLPYLWPTAAGKPCDNDARSHVRRSNVAFSVANIIFWSPSVKLWTLLFVSAETGSQYPTLWCVLPVCPWLRYVAYITFVYVCDMWCILPVCPVLWYMVLPVSMSVICGVYYLCVHVCDMWLVLPVCPCLWYVVCVTWVSMTVISGVLSVVSVIYVVCFTCVSMCVTSKVWYLYVNVGDEHRKGVYTVCYPAWPWLWYLVCYTCMSVSCNMVDNAQPTVSSGCLCRPALQYTPCTHHAYLLMFVHPPVLNGQVQDVSWRSR